ncbi:class I SAM-dependent methyltransferase [Sediminibacillus massiliensis]|uniref:class I SAM-dependent methyltransferase n=1 Tax=Sediminibacillus massiliensis TaxID=1926277 RepID=UPI0009884308|nr:class I SAM-dependent methyltransferase [Sediminibacillus massiliensis]
MANSFDWHKEAEKQWDERSAFWKNSSKEMWETGSRKSIVPFFEKHVPKHSSVIDAGCGDGYGSYKLMKSGYNVTGFDLSSEMIEKARNTYRNQLTFKKSDLVQLPVSQESTDAIIAINSLEWTEEPIQAIAEFDRVVKNGGKICIGLLGPTAGPRINSYPRLYGEKAICNTMMPWELQKLAKEKGWKLIDGKGVYKQGIEESNINNLLVELKQALSFMWLFMFEKEKEGSM